MNKDTFYYMGYHFTPVMRFDESQFDFFTISRQLKSDRDMGLSTYDNRKKNYSHAGFYQASTKKDFDVFLCEENGKLYIPCQNELFEYVSKEPEKFMEASKERHSDTNHGIRKSSTRKPNFRDER
jgi:hypothetical protein